LASVSYIFRVFIKGATVFIGKGGAIINKESLTIERKSFKTAKAGVNRHNLKWRLMTYKLKGLLILINSLISVSNYSI
jgi:hypothetical protein